jgi:hypothetical protein
MNRSSVELSATGVVGGGGEVRATERAADVYSFVRHANIAWHSSRARCNRLVVVFVSYLCRGRTPRECTPGLSAKLRIRLIHFILFFFLGRIHTRTRETRCYSVRNSRVL